MHISAKVEGDFGKLVDNIGGHMQSAFRKGVKQTTDGLKTDLRKQVESAGLGKRLANTWRGNVYPQRGVRTFNPAGVVFSKAPVIVRTFDEGAVIRSKHGPFLAVPTENVQREHGRRGRKLNPASFAEAGIRLRFIPPSGNRRVALLVADDFRINKKGRPRYGSATARRTGRGLATVVMFILIPQVRLRKRLDVARATGTWERKFPSLIEKELARDSFAALEDFGIHQGKFDVICPNARSASASSSRTPMRCAAG